MIDYMIKFRMLSMFSECVPWKHRYMLLDIFQEESPGVPQIKGSVAK